MATIRAQLNTASPTDTADLNRAIAVGDMLDFLLAQATFTETGVTVTSSVATLANAPSALFIVQATTATSTGVKKLLIGPTTGDGAITPDAGYCVWDGNVTVKFNSTDAVTVAKFMYAVSTEHTSILQRTLGQSP